MIDLNYYLERLRRDLHRLAVRLEQPSIEQSILQIVARLQRDYGRGVLPRMVAAQMDIYRAEGTLRRDMMRLVDEGKLKRVGGRTARRGYMVA